MGIGETFNVCLTANATADAADVTSCGIVHTNNPANINIIATSVNTAVSGNANYTLSFGNTCSVCMRSDAFIGGAASATLCLSSIPSCVGGCYCVGPTCTCANVHILPMKTVDFEICGTGGVCDYCYVCAHICSNPPMTVGDCYCICLGFMSQADSSDGSGAYGDSRIFSPTSFSLLATPGTGYCSCGLSFTVSCDNFCVGVSACTENCIGLSRGQLILHSVTNIPGSISNFQEGFTCTYIDAQAPTV